MTNDPCCGTMVDEEKAPAKTGYKGQIYYFCSSACKEKFEKQPDRYVKEETSGKSGCC